MNENVENIIKSITSEIDEVMYNEQIRQLKEMIDSDIYIFRGDGTIKHDKGKLSMVYSICSDDIIKRLNNMEMREEITEEELDYIKEKTDLT